MSTQLNEVWTKAIKRRVNLVWQPKLVNVLVPEEQRHSKDYSSWFEVRVVNLRFRELTHGCWRASFEISILVISPESDNIYTHDERSGKAASTMVGCFTFSSAGLVHFQRVREDDVQIRNLARRSQGSIIFDYEVIAKYQGDFEHGQIT
tara:strand:+ start:17357 stop:17803 length:447 start_codon:yes stop_codon:yes gene_type:complete